MRTGSKSIGLIAKMLIGGAIPFLLLSVIFAVQYPATVMGLSYLILASLMLGLSGCFWGIWTDRRLDELLEMINNKETKK